MSEFDPRWIRPEFDRRRHGRGIGIIAPFDFVLDAELWMWARDASLHTTRTPQAHDRVGTTMASELRDPAMLANATRDLLAAEPDVVLYACTSASFVDGVSGERELRQVLESAGAPRAMTTSGAILEALDVLDASSVGVASPYDAELTDQLVGFLEESGREVAAVSLLDLKESIAWVADATVRDLVRAATAPAVDAVVVACTNLPTGGVLPELEAELDRPVVSANLASMWASLRAVGTLPRDRPERLFAAGRDGT